MKQMLSHRYTALERRNEVASASGCPHEPLYFGLDGSLALPPPRTTVERVVPCSEPCRRNLSIQNHVYQQKDHEAGRTSEQREQTSGLAQEPLPDVNPSILT